MDSLNLDMNKRYTYADYSTWFDDVRRELFDGFIKLMSPSPNLKHQIISGNLFSSIKNYLHNKSCKVLYAPSDVRLPNNKLDISDNKIYTVVQPDIFVVCDPSKLDVRGCLGAPDLIIEIISPKNSQRDVKDKFKIYEEHGVREYWIVNPNDENVNVFILNQEEKYQLVSIYAGDDKIPVNIFNAEFEVDLLDIFE